MSLNSQPCPSRLQPHLLTSFPYSPSFWPESNAQAPCQVLPRAHHLSAPSLPPFQSFTFPTKSRASGLTLPALPFFSPTSKSDSPQDCFGKNKLTQRCRLPSTSVHHPLKALKKRAVHGKHIFTFHPAALLPWGRGKLREALRLFGQSLLRTANIQLLAAEYA